MNRWVSEAVLRAAALCGLGMSVLLVAEYRDPMAALCAPGGGCETVRESAYAALFGVPLPLIGVLFFSVVLCLAIAPQARRWLLPLSAAGAVAGVAFIALQAVVLHAFCRLCLVVDGAALIVGGAAYAGRRLTLPRLTVPAAAVHIFGAAAVTAVALCWHASLGGAAAARRVAAGARHRRRVCRFRVSGMPRAVWAIQQRVVELCGPGKPGSQAHAVAPAPARLGRGAGLLLCRRTRQGSGDGGPPVPGATPRA